MADDEPGFEIDNSEPAAPGERLRAAREAKGMSIEDVASATRIPRNHLESIEDGDFAVLPGRTYAIGFSRSYAKAVGLNDDEIVNEVREQLGIEDPSERLRDGTIQTEDPTRLPSRGLVIGSIVAAVILLLGLFAFSRTFFSRAATPALRKYFCAMMSVATCDQEAGTITLSRRNTVDPSGLRISETAVLNSIPS